MSDEQGILRCQSMEAVFLQSYYVQYTSIVLILLTFVVGAFAGNKLKTADPAAAKQGERPRDELVQAAPIGGLVYGDLFQEQSNELNAGEAEALALVLSSHDVDARIEVYAPQEATGPGFASAIGRTISLLSFLRQRQVPVAATEIVAVAQQGEGQARVIFTKADSTREISDLERLDAALMANHR